MKTADELKQSAKHDYMPGHFYFGKSYYQFTEDELEEYVNKCKNEGLEKLMYDFFKGSGFERLAEAQQKEAAKQKEIERNKSIREQYEYLTWRIDKGYMLSEQQRADFEYCLFKMEDESKQD